MRSIDKRESPCCLPLVPSHKYILRIIHTLLSKEEQYVDDLDSVEIIFIDPLCHSGLSVASGNLHDFLDKIFRNLLQVRDANKRLLEILRVRQREQAPVIRGIGDIFLDAVTTDFKEVYPIYLGHHSFAEKQLREELEKNPEFRLFVEVCICIVEVIFALLASRYRTARGDKAFALGIHLVPISNTSSIDLKSTWRSIECCWKPFTQRQIATTLMVTS